MNLETLPRATKRLRNLFALFYGPPGSGKTAIMLKIAQRLKGEGGIIIAVDADEGRILDYAKKHEDDPVGYDFRHVAFRDQFNPLELTDLFNSLAEGGEAHQGPVVVVVDNLTPFYNGPGGLKWRNDHLNVKKINQKKDNTFAAWSYTKPQEEDPLYVAMRRFTDRGGHLLASMEESIVYGDKQAEIGFRPDFRKGLGHKADFLFHSVRAIAQTKADRSATAQGAFADVHHLIVEKTSLMRSTPQEDGSTVDEYPLPTGTVFTDPDGSVTDLIMAELHDADMEADAQAERYLEHLRGGSYSQRDLADAVEALRYSPWPDDVKDYVRSGVDQMRAGLLSEEAEALLERLNDADSATLLEAYRSVEQRSDWPEELRRSVCETIRALGAAAKEAEAAEHPGPMGEAAPAEAAPAEAGPPAEASGEWADLVTGSDLDDWLYTADRLCLDDEGELAVAERDDQIERFAAFIAHAEDQERLDQVKVALAAHASSLGIDIKTDVLRRDVSA